MENFNFDELKNIMEGLLSVISCPVCFNTLRSPVCCTNGHGVCATCRYKLAHCPLCTEPFSASSSKSVLLNGMLDLLPHTCQFDGCEVLVKPAEEHETWCSYQEIWCRVTSCEWIGRANDILDHIKENHDKIIISETNSHWRLTVKELEKGVRHFVNFGTRLAQDNYLWMYSFTLQLSDGHSICCVRFSFVPNENIITNSFRITLAMGDSNLSYSSSVKKTPKQVAVNMWFAGLCVGSLVNSEGYIPCSLTIDHDKP